MAIPLSAKPNVDAPGGDYQYGNIKNNTGGNNGTPVNKVVYADFHQWFARLLDKSGIVANGNPDNDANGYQYFEAFLYFAKLFRGVTELSGSGALSTDSYENLVVTSGGSAVDVYLMAGAVEDNAKSFGVKAAATGITTLKPDGTNKINGVNADYIMQPGDSATLVWDNANNNFIVTNYSCGTRKKVFTIGAWDMVASGGVNFAHGFADVKKIRSVSIMIIRDSQTAITSLLDSTIISLGTTQGGYTISGPTIFLSRTNAGYYDDSNFSSVANNRGFVTVEYVE
jgi:hypothetical protein